MELHLSPFLSAQAKAETSPEGVTTLTIPSGPGDAYRVAQVDDYHGLQRKAFPWQPPLALELSARVSNAQHPGTWGFGLWNDPFALKLGAAGSQRRWPALPNAAWFFGASAHNHLSLRDDRPGNGFLAAVFRAPLWPLWSQLPAALLLPGLLWKVSAHGLRWAARRVIHTDSAALNPDPTRWHTYRLEVRAEGTSFFLDGQWVWSTPAAPRGPLGVVIWIDNQYAAYRAWQRPRFGVLAIPQPAWLAFAAVRVERL